MFYVYILKSLKNNKSYTGLTNKKLEIRIKEHNSGSNYWTRQNGPFKLIYYESYFCKEDAMNREKFLKSGIGKRLVKAIKNEFK